MNKELLIIFDIDDTLTQTAEMHQAAFNRALSSIGIQEHEFDLNSFLHHTDSYISKEIYERMSGREFTKELREQFEQSLWTEICQQQIQEISGAPSFVTHLYQKAGIPYCFASGALRRTALYKLKQVNIPFDAELVVASDDHFSREAILEEAIVKARKHYKVDSFNKIFSIGDGIWDLRAAQKLGLNFIGIGSKNIKVMQEAGMVNHFNDFSDFDAILKDILES